MAQVLVTGATGFVGANLVRRLVGDGHNVHALVRPTYSPWRVQDLHHRLTLHVVDLTDPSELNQVVARIAPQWVFHLAVYGAYATQKQLRAMVETNVLGTVNLVEASLKSRAEVLVNTGSSSEYGFKSGPPAETDSTTPYSAYAMTKLCATQLCRSVADGASMRIPTLRLYSVYGPFEEPSRLIPTLLTHARQGRLPPLANPRTSRDFVYVDDVVDAFLLAATRPLAEPGRIFNVGTGTQTSIQQLVDTVRTALRISAEPQWNTYPDRTWDTDVWVADSHRIRTELEWRPRFALEEGLNATARWLAEHPDLAEHYRASATG